MAESAFSETNHSEMLRSGTHMDPHGFLGLHRANDGSAVIRFFAPMREEYEFEFKGKIVKADRMDENGYFSYKVPIDTTRLDYRITYISGLVAFDPYSFPPTFSPFDEQRFSQGIHYEIYECLGSHAVEHMGVQGVKFAVWAPNADRVSLVGDFNHWREFTNPMRKLGTEGVWEIFIPGILPGVKYKYAIRSRRGESLWKADPYAHQFELRPLDASVVSSSTAFCWRDSEWMNKRAREHPIDGPMNIYEVHLGSWKKKNERFPNYRELAAELVPYLLDMGYTHLELLPVTEHPLDESWGYQVTGYYAPTSRYGNLVDFQYFVNHLHMHNIGVILDWTPGHFPMDAFSLKNFDGEHLYEKECSVMSRHPQWDTCIFDYGRKEVSNFLIGSALFWIEKMHIDGIRVDAVQSMLYLDFGRGDGYWRPNQFGGKEDLEAIEFLKHLNSIVHSKHPGVLMIAEDASLFSGVTRPVEWGGLGFDLKWSLGWMNDSLAFMKRDPIHRKYHMNEILKSYDYCFTERFILPISHDEVVHEKKSLISKMPLDEWHQFAQARMYYGASICHPGKSLFFMGVEIAQRSEWNCKDGLDWGVLENHMHIKMKKYIHDVNHLYLKSKALWQIDFDQKGFEWIDHNDYDHSVISYLRKGVDQIFVCIHNYTAAQFNEYFVRLRNVKEIRELLNSDDTKYGGSGMTNPYISICEDKSGFVIKMPQLATMIFEVVFEDSRF